MNRSYDADLPLWARLFRLPEQPGLPIQVRLRAVITQAILDGRLPAGAALPSSRDLAQALSLSRNTVTAAYEQLVEEGFLEARPRRGVFVAANACAPRADVEAALEEDPFRSGRAGSGQRPPEWRRRVLRSQAERPTLAKPEDWHRYPYQFIYGTYDPELFPTDDFRECCLRSLGRVQLPNWTPDFEQVDVQELVAQIRQRLLPQRGVYALADEILVTIGSQHACYLLAEALFDRHTRVGFEEPGHPHARNSFSVRGPQMVNLPVDDEGLVVDGMPEVDYVFVTPSHQSPTTRTLSLERRQWLLRKAELHDFVVIEDDYEAENLYAGTPMPALKSLDTSGRVIYIGSLSKSLSPALRLGYIVAPRELIAELRVLRHAQVRHPSAFLQHAYALFLSLGHHGSHARRVNQIMQERLMRVSAALTQHLPDFRFTLPQGGASVWVEGPDWLDSGELADVARAHGVLIEAGRAFYDQPPYPCPSFRLRLSSISGAQIEDGIRALALAVGALAAARGVSRTGAPFMH
ncbi:PLP-dependent aminotransferase family protein [Xenophilus arseniciresistens]|uniref:PLP-dependent aminotransferase family protein n=1 Tax=Xenophilus arseniciresistens TaxID=1283306 RepID=A0AAE3NFB8_9BURK|nr:PLP-dependent aminotransferase family protein [Xenophilus arseniciresistens]MDA7418589.1 PLP-dependent aminotransferase family protein [Xenophilus arseniciresistens]